jgi:hypothetical protein
MEISDTKVAIGTIGFIVVGLCAGAYMTTGAQPDIGTIGMAIAAIAGLAGFDMRKKE